MANIIPVYKKGSKNLVDNYQPVSLWCVINKLFEKRIFDIVFPITRNLLAPIQHACMNKRGNSANLIEFYDLAFIEQNRKFDVIYLDFSWAFDSVPHNVLERNYNLLVFLVCY